MALARSLQLEVVAEGIEEQSQLDLLVGMGCELRQGFLVSPPVPAQDLPAAAATIWGRSDVRLTAFGWSIARKPSGPAHQFEWPAPATSPTSLPEARSA